jgi:hypothetical protein
MRWFGCAATPASQIRENESCGTPGLSPDQVKVATIKNTPQLAITSHAVSRTINKSSCVIVGRQNRGRQMYGGRNWRPQVMVIRDAREGITQLWSALVTLDY